MQLCLHFSGKFAEYMADVVIIPVRVALGERTEFSKVISGISNYITKDVHTNMSSFIFFPEETGLGSFYNLQRTTCFQ